MATYYTERDMVKVLRELHIAPEQGKVTGQEAARILSWRAKHEQDVEYHYDATAIRQHIKQGRFPEGSIDHANPRRNLYPVEIIFQLPLAPKRGSSRKKAISQSA
jgi:hypothetical protein